MSHLFISAAHKSSGKTTITIGLCAALTTRAVTVQPFKKGPDYIDPLWLTQASRRDCYNLDFYTMNPAEIKHKFNHYSQNTDISIIEGNKGLYDGMDVEGSDSNAALACLLEVPVILVIDTKGMTRGIAPLLLGYQLFSKKINIAGVILNQVGGERHESKLRTAVEYHTDIPVIGAVRRNSDLEITERHLGLVPSNEENQAQIKIDKIAELIASQVNLEQIFVKSSNQTNLIQTTINFPKPQVKIGVIRDAAFGFYYPDDLVALQNAGAELVFINALQDAHLPSVDALFIGGGFPEEKMLELANNKSLKQDIYTAIENNMPVYAECGGLMYLSRKIIWQQKSCEMVGILPFDTIMETQPQGRGYVHLSETGQGLWPLLNSATHYAHEFHYSRVTNLPTDLKFAYKVLRGEGLDGKHDGIIYKNTLASYSHLRDVEGNHWTQRFVEFIHSHKKEK
ncbi:hydrogenobyrinic acid a,c-diamide synthase (glutamine-hydrolyzing) [Candidatus Halobeggiatoa sp. HSG11]|nr:hydrogenobyrinic acid a,c-diamide synthase (glutamine-hydrolyzing) [Candidatus Halobeggiatoa sp. HSG11]